MVRVSYIVGKTKQVIKQIINKPVHQVPVFLFLLQQRIFKILNNGKITRK